MPISIHRMYKMKTGKPFPHKSARMGIAAIKDTARINHMLKQVKDIFPRDMILAWTVKPNPQVLMYLDLVALKTSARDGSAAMGGDMIVDARQDYDQNGGVNC